MNRREFLFLSKLGKNTAELSCEQLYMRCLDSTLDGTTSQFFQSIEDGLGNITSLHLNDSAWLGCDELRPVRSILAAFCERGGHIEYQESKS